MAPKQEFSWKKHGRGYPFKCPYFHEDVPVKNRIMLFIFIDIYFNAHILIYNLYIYTSFFSEEIKDHNFGKICRNGCDGERQKAFYLSLLTPQKHRDGCSLLNIRHTWNNYIDIAMEKGPLENVFPMRHGDIPLLFSFTRGCMYIDMYR